MPGTYLEEAWHVLGIVLACAWNMLGVSLAYASYSMHTQSGTALQHQKNKKVVKVPNVKHYAWHMLGICVAYVWNQFGISLAYAWKVLGISLPYARNMLGICAWNMLGLGLACAWHMLHIPCILNQALPCNVKNPRKW